MGQPLSMDLHARILAATDDGMNCHAAGARLGFAPSTTSDPPPQKWSDLKYVLWHQGGSEYAKEETHA